MAGDWIKIEHWTPDKPEVFQMAETLRIDPDAVCGKLLRLWIWADQQTIDGNAASVTKALLDRITSVTGFADAMIAVGWLSGAEGGFRFVNFERHNGYTSKQRAQTAKRVEKSRALGETQVKRKCNDASVTSALPEKRREEKSKESTNVLSLRAGFVRPSVDEVAAYCAERGNQVDAQTFVDFYESKGWRIGQNAMRDWKAAVRTWEKNEHGKSGRHSTGTGGTPKGREAERIERNLGAIGEFLATADSGPMFGPAVRQGDGGANRTQANVRLNGPADSGVARESGQLPG